VARRAGPFQQLRQLGDVDRVMSEQMRRRASAGVLLDYTQERVAIVTRKMKQFWPRFMPGHRPTRAAESGGRARTIISRAGRQAAGFVAVTLTHCQHTGAWCRPWVIVETPIPTQPSPQTARATHPASSFLLSCGSKRDAESEMKEKRPRQVLGWKGALPRPSLVCRSPSPRRLH
jgi:hypothetical protein